VNIARSVFGAASKFARPFVRLTNGFRDAPAVDSVEAAAENVGASVSRITDVESARVIIELTKASILFRAKTSLSGQANQSQRNIIGLIQ
jgi:hypothetical protein